VIPLEPPIDIGREAARREAVGELLSPDYEHESLIDRIWGAVTEFWSDLLDHLGRAGPQGVLALVLLAAVLLGPAALLLANAGRLTRAHRPGAPLVTPQHQRSAAEHRANAERLADRGRWTEAIQERLRGMTRDLEERLIIRPVPGRTTDELAAEAGAALPDFAADLRAAARLFDDVTYGTSAGTSDDYAELVRLDDRLTTRRPERQRG